MTNIIVKNKDGGMSYLPISKGRIHYEKKSQCYYIC